MLQRKAVDKAVFDLIRVMQSNDYLKDFILVGGTGLALMIGHRKSVDIDMFTLKDFDAEYILEKLESDLDFHMDFLGRNTIKGLSNGIKVDLLGHKYPLIGEIVKSESIRIASLDDISAMKLNSIANDGTRVKDFIDLYFLIAQHDFNVEKLLNNYEAKYTRRNTMHVLKSLNYFEDVDLNDWPDLIINKDISWNDIMNALDKASDEYIKSIT